MTTYTSYSNATFLDYAGYQLVPQSLVTQLQNNGTANLTSDQLTQVQSILTTFMNGVSTAPTSLTVTDQSTGGVGDKITVGLVVQRDADPTALLAMDWADRQAALADQTTIWNTYGSTAINQATQQTNYQMVLSAVEALVGQNAQIADGVTSSSESRTIWLQLDGTQFQTLFGTDLLHFTFANDLNNATTSGHAWSGNLSLPDTIQPLVSGLWVEENLPYGTPAPINSTPVVLADGFQSPGNALVGTTTSSPTPTQVAQTYNFPLTGLNVTTAAVGLVEGGIPTGTNGLPATPATLQSVLEQYRTTVLGLPATADGNLQVFVPSTYFNGDSAEESLDISVVAGASPNSTIQYYVSSAGTLATMQNAIFAANAAPTLSSSFTDTQRFSPNSPFASAYNDVVVDAALSNISVFLSSGDGGSGGEYGSGTTMGRPSHASPYAVIVGGTSVSSLSLAAQDYTLSTLYDNAMDNNAATLMELTASGLMALPQNMSSSTFNIFVQTVWNTYALNADGAGTLSPSYLGNNASTGGVYAGSPVPTYQTLFGLSPTDVAGNSGRGLPDVSALAGGNSKYESINSNYISGKSETLTTQSAGTSAATPLWASLTAQIDTIFADQNLPNLGYYNDLLYIADAIAPGSFADVTIGNNNSTYYMYAGSGTAPYIITQLDDNATSQIIATGQGYSATSGYDQTTGLGTPNGVLLARALTVIAHTQAGTQAQPDVVTALSEASAQSTTSQSLLVQATGALGAYDLEAGHHIYSGTADASAMAWTNRLAEQVMQQDFDPALVRLLDGGKQATPTTVHMTSGDAVSSTVAGYALGLYQADLTAPYGFASFGGQDAGVTLARPVAVAETAGGVDDQTAVVRVRQNGVDATSITFYKVDDLSGTIDGVAPGDPRYAALAAAHAYHLGDGSTALAGPGYGNYAETTLLHVNQGDLVAMALANGGQTYYGFADANETVGADHITHLWNYGLNTYGFEDAFGGGDRDYNDLIVQLDFTSLTGHGWLA